MPFLVSKLLQNRMTAKAKRLSQSHEALLQSDPGMSFSNRLDSNLPKSVSLTDLTNRECPSSCRIRWQLKQNCFHNHIKHFFKAIQKWSFQAGFIQSFQRSVSQTNPTNRECPSSCRIGWQLQQNGFHNHIKHFFKAIQKWSFPAGFIQTF